MELNQDRIYDACAAYLWARDTRRRATGMGELPKAWLSKAIADLAAATGLPVRGKLFRQLLAEAPSPEAVRNNEVRAKCEMGDRAYADASKP